MSKYSEWPTKEPAAQRIGISVKTLERMADAGKIEQKMRPREGGTPQAVFNPEDVEREAAKRTAGAGRSYVMPAETNGSVPPGTDALPVLRNGPATTLAEQLGQAIAAASAFRVPVADKPRVAMSEAIALGFTRENLRELVRTGGLANMGTPHRFRFRRRDLDAL
jgi:hypothetical protein